MAAENSTTTAKKKQPHSLNERHTLRLSSARHQPSPSSFFSLGIEDDFPIFSGTANFNSIIDSPKASDVTVGISDHIRAGVSDLDADRCSPPGNEKLGKVKIQGRRRLCKVAASTSNEDSSSIVDEGEEIGQNTEVDISDFRSPPVAKAKKYEGGGDDDIMDIWGELSAKFDLLSMEKRRVPKPAECMAAVSVEEEVADYASAGSSFTKSPHSSGSASDAGKQFVENNEADIEVYETDEYQFVATKDLHSTKKVMESAGSSFTKSLNSSGSASDVGKQFVENNEADSEVNEADESQFVATKDLHSTKKVMESAASSFTKSPNSSGSASDAGKQFVENNEADSEIYETDDYQFVAKKDLHSTKKVMEDDRAHAPGVSHDDEDSDDDCVIVETENLPGGKKLDSLFEEKFDRLKLGKLLDGDHSKEAVSKDEHCITLKGPKSMYKLSGKIGKMLYPHQRDGLKWLWALHCQGKGGILGDDMGLGKTMQICGFLAGLFHCRLIKRVAIVAPKTLIPHWIKELGVVGLSFRTRDFYGTNSRARQYELQYVLQDGGIILTTYDIVRNNFKQLCQNNSHGDESDEDEPIWDYMILDEGHLIKNPSTQRAQSLLSVPCAHRIIISGTPIQNNLKELWALFHFCCPDLLGDKKWFKERYENPILRGNDKKATEREKLIGSTVAKELREHIQPYFLRRMKSEVFKEKGETGDVKLSKKNELIVWLRLTSVQRRLYEAFLNSELVLSSFDGSPLAAITILKKICDHPYLLTKRAADEVLDGMDATLNGEDREIAANLAQRMAEFSEGGDYQGEHDNVSCKISFIMSLLANLIPQGHNVLIFSQTRKMLNYIQDSLASNGLEYQRIDGTTKACDRLSIVNDFQEGRGAPIFLLTSQVGGLGLTLTKADRVIVVDPAWNPSMDSQSVDRAYRIGQKKDVLVYRLMTSATIEEKIYRMQVFKGGLFKTATEQKEQTRYFTKQDLKELFSLPKDGFDVSPTQQQLHEEHRDQIVLSDSLKEHLKFLDTLGIGGVSHHSLLYSKTEPTPVAQDDEEPVRVKETMAIRNAYSYNAPKRHEDGAEYANFAINPKDVRAQQCENKPSPDDILKMTESQITERITRLSQLLSNKTTVARLPDSGSKIQKQLEDLNFELENLRKPKNGEVIDLDDDITYTFNTFLKI